MFRLAIFCLCVSSILALPSKSEHSKVFPLKLKGPRIVNGDAAAEGQFPWQAALFVAGDEFGWFCGGSIIGEEWILTAGHCVNGALSAEIVTGSLDPYGDVASEASQFILHENYNEQQLENDIGLIKLEKPLTLNGNTAAIALASEELEADVEVTVSGWGLTSDDGLTISDALNFVQLVTIANDECEEAYVDEGSIGPEMVCATSPSSGVRSTCSGDSGGPLVANADSDPVHVAVVSFVSDLGCESGLPSGYTRTAYYRDWIKEHTGI